MSNKKSKKEVVDIETETEELEILIQFHSVRYYTHNDPEISDEEFDLLTVRLAEIDPDNQLLGTPNYGAFDSPEIAGREKIKHSFRVEGLAQVSLDSLDSKDIEKLNLEASVKLDGLTGVAYYKGDGNLKYVLTRNDGDCGVNITSQAIGAGIPETVEGGSTDGEDFHYRGEFVISKENFVAHQKAFKHGNLETHPRNVASGIMMLLGENEEVKKRSNYVDFAQFSKSENAPEWLLRKVKSYFYLGNGLPSEWMYKIWETCKPETEYKYPTDGLVTATLDSLGGEVYNKVKFQSGGSEATLLEVNWRLTEGNRLIPHGTLSPTFVDGAILSHVSLYNYMNFKNRIVKEGKGFGFGVGSKFKIRRANLVIPEVVEVLTNADEVVHFPTHCPCCNMALDVIGEDLRCSNVHCGNLHNARVRRLIENFLVHGESGSRTSAIMEKIVDGNGTANPRMIDPELIETDSKIQRLVTSFKYDPIELRGLIDSINIRGWGGSTIEKAIDTVDWKGERSLSSIRFEGLGEELGIPKEYRQVLNDFLDIFWGRVRLPVQITEKEKQKEEQKNEEKVKFQMTGKIKNYKKSELEEKVKDFAIVDSKHFAIMVTDSTVDSAKIKLARSIKGVSIMNSQEFLRIFSLAD